MSIIVGTRPSGKLHLGHYASVIKPALDIQDDYEYKRGDIDVMIAALHAPYGDVKDMREQLERYGVDNVVVQMFDQDTFFKLLSVTPSHLLKSMPQYKATEDKNGLMYIYPVLMAHDLIGYDNVIVGDDQRAHIEFAKDILPRIGEKCPEATYTSHRIMDLRHPENKMSKSIPESCLFLDDPDYKKKIMKAVTTPEGRKNLENIYVLLNDDDKKHRSIPEMNSTLKEEIIYLYEKHFVNI